MSQSFVRPDVAAFLEFGRQSGQPALNHLPIDEARAMLARMRVVADADPTPLARIDDVVIETDGRRIGARLYDRRRHRDESPIVLFYHGGGFMVGDLDTHEPFCTHLADQIDLPVLAVDYRLAPEHPFPAGVADAEAAARWAAESPAALGLRVSGIITCGDSAGGNLAVVVARQLADRPAAIPVIAQWVIYPFFGCGSDWPSYRSFADGYMLTAEAMAWFDRGYAAVADDPRYNCMVGPAAPGVPLLIQTAGLDPLRDHGRAYAEKARGEGVRVRLIEAEGLIHGFICLRRAIPSAAFDIGAFIAEARAMLAEPSILPIEPEAVGRK
jgi:acetyl esterase